MKTVQFSGKRQWIRNMFSLISSLDVMNVLVMIELNCQKKLVIRCLLLGQLKTDDKGKMSGLSVMSFVSQIVVFY